MSTVQEGSLIRPSGSFMAASLLIAVLSLWAVRSEGRDVRPSDHGLSNQKSPQRLNPAMAAFFKGAPSGPALPEALNSSDPFRGATPGTLDHGRGGRHVRAVLLIASLACGAVGLGLLVGALFVYVIHSRRSKSQQPN